MEFDEEYNPEHNVYGKHSQGLDIQPGDAPIDIGGLQATRDENGDLVFMPPEPEQSGQSEPHGQNLVEILDKKVVDRIGQYLKELVDQDWNSGEENRQIIATGIKQLGLNPESKDKPFLGASNVYSSSYKTAALTFVSNSTSELLPSSGYSDTAIIGTESNEAEECALRRKNWNNFYLQVEYKDFTPETERALLWTCIAGNAYKKVYQDPNSKIARPLSECVKPEDFIINYGAKSIQSALRKTQILTLNIRELRQRENSGLYARDRRTEIQATNSTQNDDDIVNTTVDMIDGRIKDQITNLDKIYEFAECHTYLNLGDFESGNTPFGNDINDDDKINKREGESYDPYIATFERSSGKMVGLYKNWREDDETRTEISHFVQYTYLPGFGIFGLGLAHIASNDAKAAATIKRLCIDSSLMSSIPGGFKIPGLKENSNNIMMEPGVFKDLETGTLPINQAFASPPFQPPNPVVMSIGDKIEDNILQMASINEQKIADYNQNAPATTTIALLEQSHKLQSSVIKRLHRALGEEFQLISDIFKNNLTGTETYPYEMGEDAGRPMLQDFEMPIKIIPISDPNNNSSFLRIVKSEGLIQTAMQAQQAQQPGSPPLFDMREVYYRYIIALGHSDPDKLMPDPKKLEEEALAKIVKADPLQENITLLMGGDIDVELGQDHDAHMASHNDIAQGLDPSNPDHVMMLMKIKIHNLKHERAKYIENIEQMSGQELTLEDPLPLEIQNMIAQQAVGQIEEKAAANQQEPPIDPAAVMLEDVNVKRMATENKAVYEHEKNEVELKKAEMKSETDMEKLRLEAAKVGL